MNSFHKLIYVEEKEKKAIMNHFAIYECNADASIRLESFVKPLSNVHVFTEDELKELLVNYGDKINHTFYTTSARDSVIDNFLKSHQ